MSGPDKVDWPDLSAYGIELVFGRSARAQVLLVRAAPSIVSEPDADARAELVATRLMRLGFERGRDGTWTRRLGKFAPRRFAVHLPEARFSPRDPASIAVVRLPG